MVKKLGQYSIVGELGRGGMGVVLKAHDPALDRFVAIKVLNNSVVADPVMAERFKKEARSAAALNHPNIVQVYSIGEEQGQLYFVMEFVEGESLSARIRREKRLAVSDAARVIHQVASGLAAAHDRGIIHRDIKPANIMITHQGHIKIADFGIAFTPDAKSQLTQTGHILGTPGYLPPEVCQGEKSDNRSDIFSLGIVYFEMLSGTIPFQSDSPMKMLHQVVTAKIPDIRHINDQVDQVTYDILEKMVSKQKEARYADCHQLVAALETGPAGAVNHHLNAAPPIPSDSDATEVIAPPSNADMADTIPQELIETPKAAFPPPLPQQDAAPALPPTVMEPAAPLPPTQIESRPPLPPTQIEMQKPPEEKKSRVFLFATLASIAVLLMFAVGLVIYMQPEKEPEPVKDPTVMNEGNSSGGRSGDDDGTGTASLPEQPSPLPKTVADDTAPPSGLALTPNTEPLTDQTPQPDPGLAITPPDQMERSLKTHTQPLTSPGPGNIDTSQQKTVAASRNYNPSDPLVALVVLGDDLLADPLRENLEENLGYDEIRLFDGDVPVDFDDIPRTLNGNMADQLYRDGADMLVIVNVKYMSDRTVSSMGSYSTVYSSRIGMRAFDLHQRKRLKLKGGRQIEYNQLNAQKKAEEASRLLGNKIYDLIKKR